MPATGTKLSEELDDDGTNDIVEMEQGFVQKLKDPVLPDIDSSTGASAGPRQPAGHAPDLQGGGGYEANDNPDQVGQLSAAQRQLLLSNNRVARQADGTYSVAAYVMEGGKGLNWASQTALVLRPESVQLEPYLGVRKDNGSSAYSEWESQWQQQTDAVAEAGGGMPLLFKVSSAYKQSDSSAGYSAKKYIYFQFSYRLTKARLIINRDGYQLAPGFVSALRNAVQITDAGQRGEALLTVFHTWGQFVGLDMTLGGRITLTKTEEMSDQSQAEQSFKEFRVAASASFTVESVPLEASGGAGTRLQSQARLAEYLESKELEMDVVGGIDKTAISDPGRFGQAWLPSPDRFERWQVIGFRPGTVVPITEFLPADIKQKCLDGLRAYYLNQLMTVETLKLGKTNWTTNFADEVAFDKAIRSVRFRFDKVLDSLHCDWEQNGKPISQGDEQSGAKHRWHGGAHDEKGNGDDGFTLDKGEEITAVEVHLTGPKTQEDAVVRNIAFYTSFGRRFPQSPSIWYGGPHYDKDSETLRVSAPRVRGFCGTEGNYIDSIGLRYFTFRQGTLTPEFLDSIDRYLFQG